MVVLEDEQVAFVDALATERCKCASKERAANSLPPDADVCGQMMNETTSSVVPAENGPNNFAAKFGGEAHRWIPLKESSQRRRFICGAQADARSSAPQCAGGLNVARSEVADLNHWGHFPLCTRCCSFHAV